MNSFGAKEEEEELVLSEIWAKRKRVFSPKIL
jgi:hypothetical protein